MMKIDLFSITYQKSVYRETSRQTSETFGKMLIEASGEVSLKTFAGQIPFSIDILRETRKMRELQKIYKSVLKVMFKSSTSKNEFASIKSLVSIYKEMRNIKNYLSVDENLYKELVLTDKHLRALAEFLEGNSNFLIVLEDDAILKENCQLSEVVNLLKICKKYQDVNLYIDLCHHFSATQTASYFNLPEYELVGSFYTGTLHSNTTAAYLINRQMAEFLLKQVLHSPVLRRIGVDWLFTFLIQQQDSSFKYKYFVVEKSFFANDSLEI